MDLKSIKATELFTTDSKFKNWVLVHGIVKLSAESKSTFKKARHHLQQKTGLESEQRAIQVLTKQGWMLLFQRARTCVGEIDLIFEKKDQVKFVEVKTLNESWRSFERINHAQLNRLIKNQIYFTGLYKNSVFTAEICWVMKNELHFVSVN